MSASDPSSPRPSADAPTFVPPSGEAATVPAPAPSRDARAATAAAAGVSLTGQVWGDFEFGELLGKGGMGVVYRGRQVSLDRPVALKVLPRELGEDEQFRERFLRESRAVGRIVSEHVVQVYFAGQHEGQHFYAMEYVDGKDLARRLKNGWRPSYRESLAIVLQAARGLQAAGELGLVHRDIKPGNLIMTGRGTVKLMDFGLVRSSSDQHQLTRTGVVMGTVSYFSPEQGRGERTDPRSDLYSLGIVFFELLTGKLPFTGESATSVIYQHIHEVPRSPRDLDAAIPAAYNAVVVRCLEKRPEKRYQSAAELVADLEAIAAGRGGGQALRIASAVVLAATIAITAWLLGHRREDAADAAAPEVAAAVAPAPATTGAATNRTEEAAVTTSDPTIAVTASTVAAAHASASPAAVDDAPIVIAPAVATAPVPKPPAPPVVERPEPAVAPPVSAPVVAVAATAAAPVSAATGSPDLPAVVSADPAPVVAKPAPAPVAVKPPAPPAPVVAKPPPPAPVAVKPPAPVVAKPAPPVDKPAPAAKPAGPPVPPGFAPARQDAFGWFADLAVGAEVQRFRLVAPGTFRMGSSERERGHERDETEHEVRLSNPFWLADSECTQALWAEVANEAPARSKAPQQPVEQVSRDDCLRFLDLLAARVPGLRPRLPSEAEWEYACRAGSIQAYGFTDKLTNRMACIRGADNPAPVKSFAPNAWGFYDLVGNVREWCADRYDTYPQAALTDPLPTGDGKGVARGGCWDDSASDCRAARRHATKPKARSEYDGLRIAVDAVAPEPPAR